jgi:hypothetical protein
MAAKQHSIRPAIGVALTLLGALLLPLGAVAIDAREHVVEPEAFADRAVEALDEEGVRRAVEREIEGAVLERARADGAQLRYARGVLDPVIDDVVDSRSFRRRFRAAARATARGFFVEELPTARVDLRWVTPLVRAELRSISPQLAPALPGQLDVELVTLRRDEFPGGDLATADNVRALAIVLPLLVLAAFAAAVALSPRRARALTRVGAATVAGAGLLAAGTLLTRTVIVGRLESEGRLTEPELERASGDLFDVYLSDLYLWALVIAAAGLVLALTGALLSRARPGSGRFAPPVARPSR